MNFDNIDLKKRSTPEEIDFYYKILSNHEEIVKIIDSMPVWVLVLNKNWQAVYYNQKLAQDVGAEHEEDIIGKRPGEILHCQNSALNENGCGNSVFCQYCGALSATVGSYSGETKVEECRIIRDNEGSKESLDLEVTVSPLELEGKEYTLFVIQDISDRNRRLCLERIFLHDLVNPAFAINSSAEMLLNETDQIARDELIRILLPASNQLLDEISAQRQILKAELKEWAPDRKEYFSIILVKECIDIVSNYLPDGQMNIFITPDSSSFKMNTEITLLKRVIINMLKNAIDASERDDKIYVTCKKISEEMVSFTVHNSAYIPKDVRMKLFNRSFSTKGQGRGIGTYSMKLLTEQYLNGRVTVESDPEKGTEFTATIPCYLET